MTNEQKKVQKPMKTRCYYTDYVNHAIRFYLSCPDKIQTAGKRQADILNWMAAQAVFYRLTDEEKQVLTEVYTAHHRLPEGVRIYCIKMGYKERGAEWHKLWALITKVVQAVAKKRGLI